MSLLGAFHGTLATVVLCVLLLVEESGVPLPLAPGDLILLSAGVLIASGRLSLWVFVPAAIVSVTVGALLGHSWARLLGAAGLGALARRFGMGRRLERIEQRLRTAGVSGILVGRLLIPGMRVNTTLRISYRPRRQRRILRLLSHGVSQEHGPSLRSPLAPDTGNLSP